MISEKSQKYNSLSSVTSMIVWATSGAAVLVLLPMLVGGFADYLEFSGKDLALLAAADMLGAAFGTLIISTNVNKINLKVLAIISILIMVAGNFASLGVSDLWMLFIIRGFCGLGEGVCMGAGAAAMSHTNKPDRVIAIYVVVALLFGATGLYLIPYILDAGGLDALYTTFAVLAILSLSCIVWLPKEFPTEGNEIDEAEDQNKTIHVTFKWMAVSAVLIYFMAQGVIWAYIERIGIQAQIKLEDIGLALGICSIFGAMGGLTAAIFDIKFGRFAPLTIAAIVSITGLLFLLSDFDLITYGIATSLFNFGWNYTYPYQLTVIKKADRTARLVSVAVAMQTFGLAIGPMIVGLFIVDGNYDFAKWLGIVLILLALLFIAPTARYADSIN